MQSSGVLPSLNTYEAHAMRVIVSTFCLPREAYFTIRSNILDEVNAYCEEGEDGDIEELTSTLRTEFQRIRGSASVERHIDDAIENAVNTYCGAIDGLIPDDDDDAVEIAGYATDLVDSLIDAVDAGCAAATTVLPELIYNSVTTLLVGEKIMIEVPTFYFPAGAGVSPGNGLAANHGEPDPMATFRFSEPVIIEPQQSFRVEMLFPQGVPGQNGTSGNLGGVTGPLRIWLVLDGYLTRDVQ